MNLPKSGYGPIKTFFLRNPLEIKKGIVREIKSYRNDINDRSAKGPENAMRCSEMVEVVE